MLWFGSSSSSFYFVLFALRATYYSVLWMNALYTDGHVYDEFIVVLETLTEDKTIEYFFAEMGVRAFLPIIVDSFLYVSSSFAFPAFPVFFSFDLGYFAIPVSARCAKVLCFYMQYYLKYPTIALRMLSVDGRYLL